MTLNDMAARVGTTRATLGRLERGDLSVAAALLAKVLAVLGLEADLDHIAADDELGQRLQDVRMRRPRSTPPKQPDD
jgi:transcriptional regulator with XRE-family HTH domain